ncbi:hypothetical protein L3Q82_005747 [Scortum barcoo]|uniref:Uncharacterized protein n=1 Tax=Scortum barcoo TaxID=214431 RepID=A0ACB8V6C1_9TELE|nr:hypothetical protein L3Q82_005747 [Scortum barcoo]
MPGSPIKGLSYKPQKATDRALFEVGSQNGEIRTIRQVTDKDAVKQRLTVIVEDNGQPSRSATVIVNVAVADSFPEVLSEFTDFTHDKEYNDNLTFYLVLALAVVSFLFITCLVVIISVKIYRWRQSRILYHSNLPVIPYYPPRYSDTLGTGTLQHVYNYEVCRTTDSRKSDMKYMQPMSQSLVSVDGDGNETPQVEKQLSGNCSQMSTLSVDRLGIPVPEEQAEGSFVGNIARDLGVDVARLVSGKARIITKGSRQYVDLNRDKGTLVIKERIDREELCGKTTPCSFSFEVILENPIQLYRVTVEVIDINDNSPTFPKDEIILKMAESVAAGTRFSLESADDPDVGINDIQKYILKPSDHFKLEVQNQPDGGRFIEMVLQNPLDREKEETHTLVLIASDGGEPHRSGTVRIHITVLDANDNAPVCSQPLYKADVKENSPEGTVVTTVNANDADKGVNGEVTYSIAHVAREAKQLFEVNVKTGEIKVAGTLDFEKSKTYQLNVKASDHGGYTDTCKVIIQIIDENDNIPTIQLMSFSNSISEDSPPGTTIAVVNVDDEDSDVNGVVKCSINSDVPFKIESSLTGYYTIVTEDFLDRESIPEYNITLTVSDQGSPPLSSSKNINVKVTDVNDSPPRFDQSEYSKTVPENNSPGFSVFTVSASDADWGQNAWLSYFLEEKEINGVAVSSLVSVNSETVQTGGSLVAEMVPRSADVGYLVTKVVAVDVDSGQNAWLSYKLQKATDRALFEVGSQNGEIRTIRQVTDKDAVKQRLTVIVEDNGQPSRSATVIVNVAVADSFPEVLSEFTDFTHTKRMVIISVKIYRWRQSRILYHSNLPVIPYYPPRYSDTLGTGTLQHVYNYELSSVSGQARYSVPEEQAEGSFVGNIARDLGVDVARLVSGKARIITKGSRQYVDLNRDKGTLVIKERIDREELCGKTTPCSFSFEVILENPIQLYRTIPDVGINDIQKYTLKPSDHFKLEVQNQPDEGRFIEMVLQNPLDREKEETHTLVLIASDGGEPHRSGTVRIHITVLDANDNAPVCSQPLYKADVKENSPEGTVVTTVNANDADKGVNGEVTYSIPYITKDAMELFEVNVKTGEIKVAGMLDFEKSKTYKLNIHARDHGGHTDTCKVIIQIIDENDNIPTIQLMSFSNSISEDSPPGTTIAVVNVDDEDSDGNGVVKCSINSDVPFKIESSLTGYYTIVTEDFLDRESIPEYNITLTVSDQGSPPLSSSKNINVKVTDVNDSPPRFDQSEYSKTVPENNSPGFSVFTVSASDADWGQNARLSYFLEEKEINGVAVSSLVSVNSETGVIHAVRSFDYEQIKWFEFNVTARDAGSPPLSSVATVRIIIQDQNDNPPQVLYPVQTGGSVVAEMVPRSADVGYLVTKVVAVDVDSGQNAWLSYKLQKATDRALFEVGSQNGEIRTIRQVTDKDAVKQRLTVIVEDNGQPSRSATVIVNVAVADSFPEVLSEFTDFTHDKEYNDNLTFYLVLALAVVSFLFITCLVVIISVKIYRWRQSRILYHSNLPVIPYYPPRYSDTLGTGTLQHVYNYEVCRTTDSRKSDMKYMQPMSQSLVSVDGDGNETPQMEKQLSGNCSHMSTLSVDRLGIPVPEEQAEGSFVGNIARDLGVDVARLVSGKARIITKGSRQYVDLNRDKGTLVIKERIDREELCGKTTPCSFSFEVILENPIQLYQVTVEVIDINDNSPTFPKHEINLKIAESVAAGTRFSLMTADDPDVGINDIQNYILKPSDHFKLEVRNQPDGGRFIEMVLQNPLDREKEETHTLVLIASDGGEPHRSGTVRIHITVLDANDNAPVCSQPLYKADVKENSPEGTVVTTVNANDADKGVNGEVTYSIPYITKDAMELFEGSPPLSSSKNINVKVTDVNDSPPRFDQSEYSKTVPENNSPGFSVFTVSASDADWGQNARLSYFLEEKEINGVAVSSLVSVNSETGVIHAVRSFDYEQIKWFEFNVTAHDAGSPPLSSVATVRIIIQDQNDNPPQVLYPVQTGGSVVAEMVPRSADVGYLVTKVVAVDVDSGQNAWLSYKLQKATDSARRGRWQTLFVILCLFKLSSVSGQARYSVPEEQAEGSFVGNIARDLGVDVARLVSGKARIITKGSRQYVDLNRDKGTLVIKERIDREELCGKTTPCSFSFEVILENPIQLYRVTVEVIDINDNSPTFPKDEISLKIAENAAAGTRFSLISADDPDVGINDIQKYILKPSDHFKLEVQNQPDGGRFIEMVLQNPLDREKEETHTLVLIASDGGEPHRSGTVRIHITVLDANDNAPVCSQPLYKADVKENSPEGTVVTTVNANDADKGVNGEVTYSIPHVAKEAKQLFEVNVKTGEIKVSGQVDFEKSKTYQLNIQASDHGGFTDTCKVIIQIIDENDNIPTIQLMSFSNSISEDSPPGTTIAVVNVDDEDSDVNGVVKCSINSDVPFKIESSLTGYYTIVTEDFLDRESIPEYNITLTVSDQGSPPLSSSKNINVKVTDVNDSPPRFDQSEYSKTVPENNSPGFSVFTVSASDADWGQNARLSYFLDEKEINGVAVSSLVSVNSETGVIHAVRSFDYEQIKFFEFNVTARDAGSPPLSSVATVRIIIQDQNDNPPQVLYPVQTGGSLVAEMVPRSADVGYLVTKVVAVDVDSGQNAWLSYKLQKATDRALFEVGSQNGEIRTIRQVTDKDAVKQRLTVIVEDNGQPSRSATVIVNVAVADSFPEVLSEFTDFTHDKEYNDNLTFYLVLALAVVSFLFITCLVVIISVKIYRWRQSRILYHSNLPCDSILSTTLLRHFGDRDSPTRVQLRGVQDD